MHSGVYLRQPGYTQHIDMAELTGRRITIYGQQELVKDLIAARLQRGGALHFEVSRVAVHASTARGRASPTPRPARSRSRSRSCSAT